jgi:hypothetical protein
MYFHKIGKRKLLTFAIAFIIYFTGITILWSGGCLQINPSPLDRLQCGVENASGAALWPVSIPWFLFFSLSRGTFDVGFFMLFNIIGMFHVVVLTILFVIANRIANIVFPQKKSKEKNHEERH